MFHQENRALIGSRTLVYHGGATRSMWCAALPANVLHEHAPSSHTEWGRGQLLVHHDLRGDYFVARLLLDPAAQLSEDALSSVGDRVGHVSGVLRSFCDTPVVLLSVAVNLSYPAAALVQSHIHPVLLGWKCHDWKCSHTLSSVVNYHLQNREVCPSRARTYHLLGTALALPLGLPPCTCPSQHIVLRV